MGKPWEKAAAASPRPAKPWEKAAVGVAAGAMPTGVGAAMTTMFPGVIEPTPIEASRARNEDAIAAMTGDRGGAGVLRQPEAPRLLARPGGPALVPTMDSRKAPFVAGRDNASALSAMTKGAQSTPDETKAPVGYRTIMTPDGTRVMGYQRNTPTMLPEERTALAEGNRREEQASRDRREAASAFGGGMDLMPTVDESGNVRPGSPSDQDIGKGVTTAPVRVERGVVAGVEGIANLPSDFLNAMATAQAQEVTQAQANRNANRMPQLQARVGQGPQKAVSYPRFDFNGAKIPITPELDSLTGQFTEGLAQYLVARKLIGAAAPGGGIAPELGKDAAATFASTDGKTGRLADMIPSSSVPEGPMRQWLDFLKTRPDDDPLLGRFKNTLEDLTISGPMVAPHLAVRGGQAVYNRLNPSAGPVTPQPPMPPAARPAPGANQTAPGPQPIPGGAAMATQTTTAGQQFSGAYRDGGKWSVNYRPVPLSDGSLALVREMTDETGTTVSHLSQDGEWVKGEPAKTRVSGMRQLSGPETFNSADQALAAARDDASGMGGQPAGASSGQPPPRTATAVPPTPPRPQAASAGAPPPAGPPAVIAPAAAGAPPPGVLSRMPQAQLGEAEQWFNSLSMKTRESILRTFDSSGVSKADQLNIIRDLNDIPSGRNSQNAFLVAQKWGDKYPSLRENLSNILGGFAVTTPRAPDQKFLGFIGKGKADTAQSIMDTQGRKQIVSERGFLERSAEQNFGKASAEVAQDLRDELQGLGKRYNSLLDPTKKRKFGPDRIAQLNKAEDELRDYLRQPWITQSMPPAVKDRIMVDASEEIRDLEWSPSELGIIMSGTDRDILAPLFEAHGPLQWSPDLWTRLVDHYPKFAAHVLQSSFAKAARGMRSSINAAELTGTIGQLERMRGIGDGGKAIPGGLLDKLQKTMPNSDFSPTGAGSYGDTRLNWGDVKGAQEALAITERFKAAAQSGEDVSDIIRQLEPLSPRQKDAALSQITSFVHDSMGGKVTNLTPDQVGKATVTAPNLTQLGNDNFLQALRKVFGEKGDALANDIELARASTTFNTDINRRINSRTQINAENVQNSPRLYEDPRGLEGGVFDKGVQSLAGLATVGSVIKPEAMPLLALLPTVKAAYNLYKKGKRLNNVERSQLADFWARSREAGVDPETLLNGSSPPPRLPPPGPRGPSPAGRIGNVLAGGAAGGAIAYGSSGGDPNATAMGILGGAGIGGIRQAQRVARNNRSLIKPPQARPTNALASPSKPPPVKAGFGFGGPPKSLDMSEPARMRRARERGFDVETPYYHGTNRARDIEEFDLGRAGQQSGSGEVAVFLSDSPERANSYANAQMKHQEPTPEGWEKTKKVFGYTDDQLRDRWLRDAPSPAVFKTYVRGPTREVDWLAENGGDPAFNSVTMKRLIAEEHKRGKDARNLRIRNMADGGNDPSATTMVVLDPRNVRATTASFDPSQSGSSKLLDSFGATPETLGAAALGGAGGAAYAQDDNKDGVIDLSERLKYAAGGAFGTTVASGMVRQVGRALGPPKAAARSVESGAVRSFTARDGTQYAVHIDDAGHVSFNANSGPKAPRNALADEFKPTGKSSLAEANEVFAGVEKAIRDDIAETGRSRYVLNGRTPRQRELYAQMAQRKQPPEGYKWEANDKGVALRKTTEAPVSREIDMTPDGYERTTQIGSAKLTYAVQPNGAMTIEMIDVPPAARGKGEAGTALDKLLAEADAIGSTVYLDPKPVGQGGLTAAQLQDFYRKRGFTKQQGSPGLVRSPNPQGARKFQVNAATFGGVNAKTADKIALGRAQNMEAAGASRDDIWRETGWFKGVDGKWRFEIDDSGAKLGDKALEEFWNNKGISARSAGVLQHKPLYDAYPEMRENTTALREQFPSGGSWDRQEKVIFADGSTPSEGRSVILHEGQHAVQDAEGFASGGSLNTFTQQKEAELARDAMFWRRELAAKRKEMPQADWIAVENAVVQDYRTNDIMDWLPSREARDLARDKISNPDAQLNDLVKAYGLDQSVSTKSPREMYRRLAGEVEARNVQTRRDFTPEQRRAQPPWTTQDVPDDQQIVRFGGNGPQNSFGFGGSKPPGNRMGPPKVAMPKRMASQLNQAKLSNELRAALAENAAKPAGEQLTPMEVAKSIDRAPEMYGLLTPYLREGTELSDQVGRDIGKLSEAKNADPINLGLRQKGAEMSLSKAEQALKEARSKQGGATRKLEAQRARNIMNPNAKDLNAPFVEARDAAERATLAAETVRNDAKAALDKFNLEVLDFDNSKAAAEKELQRIADAMGPNAPAIGGLGPYNPMRPRETEVLKPGVTAVGAPFPRSPVSGLPTIGNIGAQKPQIRGPKTVSGSKEEAEKIHELVYTPAGAKLLAQIQSGEVVPKPYSTTHKMLSYLAQNPIKGALGAAAIAGSGAGYAAIFSEADKANRDVMIKSGAMRDPNAPEPENPNAWNWERQTQRRQFVETLQLNLQQLGYKIADDGLMYRKDGKETNTIKAIKHWQWKQGHEQTGILTEEEWYTLQEQAQEVRRTQPASGRGYEPTLQSMSQ